MLCYAFNLLMAFDRLLLKGLLTYLLTYLLNSNSVQNYRRYRIIVRYTLYSWPVKLIYVRITQTVNLCKFYTRTQVLLCTRCRYATLLGPTEVLSLYARCLSICLRGIVTVAVLVLLK